MARITIEDCLDHVPNRFELVLLAAKRARQLLNGVEPKVKTHEDKHTVVALREIAEGLVTMDDKEPEEESIFHEEATEDEPLTSPPVSEEPSA